MGRQTPAYRGTVGIRGARQPGRQTLRPGATNSTIAKIAQKLSALTRGIDAGLDENSKVLSSTPSLDVLRGLATSWQQFEQNLLFWSRDLARRADQLDEEVARLDQLGKTWGQTLTRAQSSGAPPEVLQRLKDVLAAVSQLREEARSHLTQALTLQSRIAEQHTRVSMTLASVQQAREGGISRLFVQDSPPLWKVSAREGQKLVEATHSSFSRQLWALRAYAKRQRVAFVVHAVLILLLLGFLHATRPEVKRWIEEEPSLERAAPIFEAPMATAVVVSCLFSRWLYPAAPRLLIAILGAVTLIPATLVLRRLIEPRLFPILNALVAFYFIDQVRAVAASVRLLSRGLFLAEMLAAIVFLAWITATVRAPTEADRGRAGRSIRTYARLTLAVFAAALVANALGYVNLANLLGQAVLGSAYLALVLYTLLRIADGLIAVVLKARPLALLGLVRRHRPQLERRAERALHWLVILLWLGYALELLALRRPLLEKAGEVLNATLRIGSLQFSLIQVLTFGSTVWAAFLVSRFVRFVLEEDVYERFQLARGLPYAISTTLHYTILLVGFLVAVAALGLDLTKFTILAGAFSVGVGFGLQNIINNFVSGLILLFERPIKVGDVIQVGDAAGVVQRIGIRASILRAPDGSELIVPNGKMISDRVTNWTLSDSQRVIEMPISVAQGADPDHVIKLLEGVAAAHPLVVKEPAPEALVINFGPGALTFELRAWTDSSEAWMQVRSGLAIAIKAVLAKENIPIF